jgi:hypothetical protein
MRGSGGEGGSGVRALLAKEEGRGERGRGERRWQRPFKGERREAEERGGAGAVPERRCRPVAARPRWERAGGTCARGRCRTGEAGSRTSGPRATVTCGGGLNWIRMQVQTNSNNFKSFQTLTDPKNVFHCWEN